MWQEEKNVRLKGQKLRELRCFGVFYNSLPLPSALDCISHLSLKLHYEKAELIT